MKKALIVLLILAVAGGLFAQSFSGGVQTGAWFTFDGEDNPVRAYTDVPYDTHAVKAWVDFSGEGDDWGVSIGTSGDTPFGENGTTGINIGDFTGWVKFADIFKLTAGKSTGADVWQFGDIFWMPVGGNNHKAFARLEVEPISGLNVGVLFSYPNQGSEAAKLANFFQETAIGAKYDAGIFNAFTTFELNSPESTGADTDANWKFGVNVPLGFLSVKVEGSVNNLVSSSTVSLGEKLYGSIVGLDWYVTSKQDLTGDLTADLEVGLKYGIPINDKASATVGASAYTEIIPEFVADNLKWNAYGKLNYDFSGNAWTSAELGFDNGKRDWANYGDFYSKVTPYLMWLVGYSF